MRNILTTKGKIVSALTASALLLSSFSAIIPVAFAAVGPTTVAATAITSTNATLNGMSGDTDAQGSAFWVSTSTFTPVGGPSPSLPSNVYSTGDTGPVASSTAFSSQLSSATTPAGLLPITPNTTYFFTAWTEVGGVWTSGSVLSFTTSPTGSVFIDTNTNGTLDPGEQSFSTIQAAIDAASSSDTIVVGAGTYTEHVAVNKSVTLKGANAGIAGNGTRTAESIVDGSDTDAPFAVTANDVTIDGFTVENGSNGGFDAGIWSQSGTQNSTIKDNIITGNAFGVWAQCGGNCLVDSNLFDGNNKVGTGAGTASLSADSTTGLTISNNEFTNDTAGNPVLLQASAAGAHTGLVISGNTFHGNTNSNAYLLGITGGTITGNTITPASDATGISFSGLDANVSVMNNTITGGARGVRLEDAGFYGPGAGGNSAITINKNSLATDSTYGAGNESGYTGNVDATCNWWGAADGPGAVGPGSGSPVTAGVDFSSWLTTSDLGGACNGAVSLAPTVTSISPTSGTTTGGTSVTITGTNLASTTAVHFGATAATVTATSSTSVTATSPAGTGTVDVTVTTPDGTSATSSADQFTYVSPLGQPAISNVAVSGISTTSATVTWTTDVPATSQVQYGTTTSYGSSSAFNGTASTTHSVTLSGLGEATLYHFAVSSGNIMGTTTSSDSSFFTQSTASTTPLAVEGTPTPSSSNGSAVSDGTYVHGWSWVMHFTVPDTEDAFRMKFSDWTGSAGTLATANNVRIFSGQSSNANSESTAITETDTNYGGWLYLNGDTATSTAGRQIDLTIEVKIPSGTPSGTYTTNFGAQSVPSSATSTTP